MMALPLLSSFTPINSFVDGSPDRDTEAASPSAARPWSFNRTRTLPAAAELTARSVTLADVEVSSSSIGDNYELARARLRRNECHKPSSKSKKSLIIDRMPLVKDQNDSFDDLPKEPRPPSPRPLDLHVPASIIRRLDAWRYGTQIPEHLEQHVSLVAPKTSLNTLRTSPGVGCMVYDAKGHDHQPGSPPPCGHKVNRVISRNMSSGFERKWERSERSERSQQEASRRAMALVTDLEGINEALDAEHALKFSPELTVDHFFEDMDDMSDVEDRHQQDWYLGVDHDYDCAVKPDLAKRRITGHGLGVIKSVHDEFDGRTLDDDMLMADPLESSDDEDDFFMLDDEDLAELERFASKTDRQLMTQTTTTTIDEHDGSLAERRQCSTKRIEHKASTSCMEGLLNQGLHGTHKMPIIIEGIEDLPISTRGRSLDPPRDARRPIVRKAFPIQTKDRSPVTGLTANTILRTCFRIGEALKIGCQAVREGRNVVLEVYARVTLSWREPEVGAQRFVFKDLYHSNPPTMCGVHESWKMCDEEAARFIDATEEGIMCRLIGSMRRTDGTKWEMVIQGIRGTDWSKIEYVAGIYA